jgi:hypothetical protein
MQVKPATPDLVNFVDTDTIQTQAINSITPVRYDSVVATLTTNYDGYDISITTDVYEASTTINWLIDEELNVLSFSEAYAIEGTEGTREYYFENGELQCYSESESVGDWIETIYYCAEAGGISMKSNDLSDESTT